MVSNVILFPKEKWKKFRKHTDDEHGIDYSKEAVMQFLLRKQGL
jgi:hypothetical protein